MKKKYILYIANIILLITVLVITHFSYAFFTHRDEQRGRLNIVVGNLNYKIESVDLDSNNSLTLEANTQKIIEMKVTSLNDIDSKYELYYESDINIDVKYVDEYDIPSGIIGKGQSKDVVVVLNNNNDINTTVTFNINGGLISNELVLKENSISESTGIITLTFDPNGGILDTNQIKVAVGSKVGTLPTPTKEGNRFLGWKIENLYNNSKYKPTYNSYGYPYLQSDPGEGITINEATSSSVKFTINTMDWVYYSVLTSDPIQLKPNTVYTVAFNRTDTPLGEDGNRTYIYSLDQNNGYGHIEYISGKCILDNEGHAINQVGRVVATFKTSDTGKVAFMWDRGKLVDAGAVINIQNIQIEEGENATDYVFSYLNSDSILTNFADLTLRAEWEEIK